MYKLTNNSSVIKEGSLIIPFDEGNVDYREYLTWLSEGNTPEPADAPPTIYPQFRGNEKLDLFTFEEQLAVVTATMTDPQVKLMYDRMIGSAYLTYEDPETEYGLSMLAAKGLITAERKVEIVDLMQPKSAISNG